MNNITIYQYLKKLNKRSLTKNQKKYFYRMFDCKGLNDECIPFNLGKIDLRRKPKNQLSIYLTILKSMNDNYHVSYKTLHIDFDIFKEYINIMLDNNLISKIQNLPDFHSESYIVTPNAKKYLKKKISKLSIFIKIILGNIL